MNKKHLFLAWAVAICLSTQAQETNLSRMKQTAAVAINHYLSTNVTSLSGGFQPPLTPHVKGDLQSQTLKETLHLSNCSVITDQSGAFAVVSADGNRLLGVSTSNISHSPLLAPRSSKFITQHNPEFLWWLNAVNEALATQKVPHLSRRIPSAIPPNPKHYPIEVEPMITTHWGQLDPYNRELPYGNETEVLATGCVATSMAQVLYYYKKPVKGEGQRTIYYPYDDPEGIPITADFENHTYQWDYMIDDYTHQSFTDEQAHAVAVLMRDCGVAADMRYGVQSKGGSGTAPIYAVEGLHNYLGMPNAQDIKRNDYSEQEWMDIIFSELSNGHPIIYGGATYTGAGHSFVIHGYNRYGLVYVNWGWNGSDEGYYDISLLNPSENTQFAYYQDAIIGLCPTEQLSNQTEVTIQQPGTLQQQVDDWNTITAIKVSGPIDENDFATLRQAAINGCLQLIDLSAAVAEFIPEKAFYECSNVKQIILPSGIKHIGDGAFACCNYLENINFSQPADDADFIIDNDIIYNEQKDEIICALPTIQGELSVPNTVTTIHPYAFAGCVLLHSAELPETISQLGAETFRDCFWLSQLRIRSRNVPALTGYDTFKNIDMTVCELQVFSGLKTQYNRKAQWKEFKSVSEFGTTVKAKNATRLQGTPNPEFTYELTGDPVQGIPELYTDATLYSPEGVYTIYTLPGTITSNDVAYINGKLVVLHNDATDINTPPSVLYDASPMHQQLHDLQGRHIKGHPTSLSPGLYVVNGRKFLVK